MYQERNAIVFTNEKMGGSKLLKDTLEEMGISLLLPHQLPRNENGVSVVIIERPVAYAEVICSNLRRAKAFSRVPILVIVDAQEQVDLSKFAALKADVMAQATSKALRSYLKKVLALDSSQETGQRSTTHSSLGDSYPETGRVPSASSADKRQPPTINPFAKEGATLGSFLFKEASKAVSGIKEHIDDIVASSQLLPITAKPLRESETGVLCDYCQRWHARPEDTFCSRCQNRLIQLEMLSNVLTFEPLGKHRIGKLLTLRNGGQNPLRMRFEIQAKEYLAGRFYLRAAEAVLDGKTAADQQIILDADGLDLTMEHSAVLVIKTSEAGETTYKIRLAVEPLARPRPVAQPSYIYALGADNQTWTFNLANDGGGTLRLKSVQLDGVKDNIGNAKLELQEPVVVKARQSVPVQVKVPALDWKEGRYERKLIWTFENYDPQSLNIVIEAKLPPRLTVTPKDLDCGVVSTRRSLSVKLSLHNTSSRENLTVTNIVASDDWIRSDKKQSFPLIVPPGATETLNFLIVGSDELNGYHRGTLTIHSDSFESPEQNVPIFVEFVLPKPYESYLGVDFGTTASCVAVLDENNEPYLIELGAAENTSPSDPYIMPSVLYFQEDGEVIAGWQAQEASVLDPLNAVTSVKRALGLRQKQQLAGTEYGPTELTAKIIRELLRRTEDGLFKNKEYKTPRRAVVTVPVGFSDQQKSALMDACRMAELETGSSSTRSMVINEAHAVALHYLNMRVHRSSNDNANTPQLRNTEPERILVFDFGGGTLDCEVIEIQQAEKKTIVKTLGPPVGDPRLGGLDIDLALAEVLAQKAKQQYPEFDDNCVNEQDLKRRYQRNKGVYDGARISRAAFRREAEQAKIALSKSDVARVRIHPLLRLGATTESNRYLMDGGDEAQFEGEITRAELEQILTPFLKRAADLVETVCHRAQITTADIHTILHAGRTSSIPLVRSRIQEVLQQAEDRSDLIEAKTCVALGAAFWGRIKGRKSSNFEFIGGSNQLTYDIGYLDFDHHTFKDVFITVFSAGTEFPSEQAIEYPNQAELPLAVNRGKTHFAQGNPDITNLGKVQIPPGDSNESTIKIRFILNENRSLEIVFNNQSHVFELEKEELSER